MDWKLIIILTANPKVIYVLLSGMLAQDTWPCLLEKKRKHFSEISVMTS